MMTTRKNTTVSGAVRAIAGCAMLAAAAGVHATTFDFEGGTLAGWTTVGDVSADGGAIVASPIAGSFNALLSTQGTDVGDAPPFSGTLSVLAGALDSFLGLGAGSIAALGTSGAGTEGSAMKTTISGSAGDTVSFDFNFVTNEATPNPGVSDYAFVLIEGLLLIADTETAGFTAHPCLPGDVDGGCEQTGVLSFSHTLTASGTFDLGIGIVDAGDLAVPSVLLVDNVTVTSAVSEPAIAGLLVLGLAGMGFRRRRGAA